MVLVRKRRSAKRRKNPAAGKYRPTLVYKPRSGWKRPKRSKLMKKPTRVNPKRRRRIRRNPKLSIKSMFSRKNIGTIGAVAGGLTVGMLGTPMLLNVSPELVKHRKYLGGVHILLGVVLAAMSRRSAFQTAGLTLAGVGAYDLLTQNVPTIGLPTLPDAAALLAPKTASVGMDYLPMPGTVGMDITMPALSGDVGINEVTGWDSDW